MNETNDKDLFTDPEDLRAEARALAVAAIRRLLIWIADSATLDERGLRARVALYCVRPDLIEGVSLEEIGERAGRIGQAIDKLADTAAGGPIQCTGLYGYRTFMNSCSVRGSRFWRVSISLNQVKLRP